MGLYAGSPSEGWIATGTATNATATATKAAATGKTHYVTSVSGAFSAAAIFLLQLKEGTNVIGEWYVHNSFSISFGKAGIPGSRGGAVSAELSAGGVGVIGKVNITGFSDGGT